MNAEFIFDLRMMIKYISHKIWRAFHTHSDVTLIQANIIRFAWLDLTLYIYDDLVIFFNYAHDFRYDYEYNNIKELMDIIDLVIDDSDFRMKQ